MKITKPNIVFILADDMGYGDFGALNGGLSRTRALDQLMAEGVCFSQQYTASPVCNPSRACLMTGRYPHRTGSIDTLEWRGLERLALRETTLADVLKSAGYATGLVGKWHLGAFDMRYHPSNRGFDETVCFRGGMHDYYRWRLEFGDTVVRADGRYLTDVWTQEAVKFIKRHQAEPFFLHVTYNAPHTPLQAPDDEIRPFLETGKFNKAVSTLYGMLGRMDSGVAQILETLQACGLETNTIVMFTSDNGPQFGGEGEDCLDRFNCQLHGAKGSVYEGGIRVPMILRWPGGLEGGYEVDDMVHFSDWFPTILSMADVQIPPDLKIDGVNVLPLIRGEKGRVCTKRFWQWNRYTPLVTCNAAVRDGDWKLVRPAIGEAMAAPCCNPWLKISMYEPERLINGGLLQDPEPPRSVPDPPRPELYNIADDPLEKVNLADTHPDITHRLLGELEAWFEEVEQERATIDDKW
ncbi:MAG: sulfatase-like hydrolase/transferase [Planctomycetes bacterium]|nr:sulfatase-like hydrolase/transferase [Planctomycetota bacterium]